MFIEGMGRYRRGDPHRAAPGALSFFVHVVDILVARGVDGLLHLLHLVAVLAVGVRRGVEPGRHGGRVMYQFVRDPVLSIESTRGEGEEQTRAVAQGGGPASIY